MDGAGWVLSEQSYSKDSVAHVQKYLTKNEVPTHLFEVKQQLPLFFFFACPSIRVIYSNRLFVRYCYDDRRVTQSAMLMGAQPYIDEIFSRLRGDIFRKFVESDKYTRFCQWKNLELNIQVLIDDGVTPFLLL